YGDMIRCAASTSSQRTRRSPHLVMRLDRPVGLAVMAQPACIAQRTRITLVSLDPLASRRVHHLVGRIPHDRLVAQFFQQPGHPLALGRTLDQNLAPFAAPKKT